MVLSVWGLTWAHSCPGFTPPSILPILLVGKAIFSGSFKFMSFLSCDYLRDKSRPLPFGRIFLKIPSAAWFEYNECFLSLTLKWGGSGDGSRVA